MPIKKQEFYEGAALLLLARSNGIDKLRQEGPLFLVNDRFALYLKYSTKGRSPWGFQFTRSEQELLQAADVSCTAIAGLVCGSDGVAALRYSDFVEIGGFGESRVYISCYRRHGEFYLISGPNGELGRKVPPSDWIKTLQGDPA